MICLNCGRKLKSLASREAGYDPVCYRKMFGTGLRNVRRDYSVADSMSGYNIPGQITLEEYLQTVSYKKKKERNA